MILVTNVERSEMSLYRLLFDLVLEHVWYDVGAKIDESKMS